MTDEAATPPTEATPPMRLFRVHYYFNAGGSVLVVAPDEEAAEQAVRLRCEHSGDLPEGRGDFEVDGTHDEGVETPEGLAGAIDNAEEPVLRGCGDAEAEWVEERNPQDFPED